MPEVTIKFAMAVPGSRQEIISWCDFEMPGLVAANLGIEGHPKASLTPDDVEVSFVVASPRDRMGMYVLAVKVDANDYEERRPITRKAATQIRDALVRKFPALQGRVYVWVRLTYGEFVD